MPASIRIAALAATLMLGLSGCSEGPPAATDPATVELPSWCTAGPCVGVPADIPRMAIFRAAARCVWVEVDGNRASVLWPPRYRATYEPFRAYDERGRLVAQEGGVVTTVILGPFPIERDICGLTQSVQLYFDSFVESPAASK
jgi:hypothetical protein